MLAPRDMLPIVKLHPTSPREFVAMTQSVDSRIVTVLPFRPSSQMTESGAGSIIESLTKRAADDVLLSPKPLDEGFDSPAQFGG